MIILLYCESLAFSALHLFRVRLVLVHAGTQYFYIVWFLFFYSFVPCSGTMREKYSETLWFLGMKCLGICVASLCTFWGSRIWKESLWGLLRHGMVLRSLGIMICDMAWYRLLGFFYELWYPWQLSCFHFFSTVAYWSAAPAIYWTVVFKPHRALQLTSAACFWSALCARFLNLIVVQISCATKVDFFTAISVCPKIV